MVTKEEIEAAKEVLVEEISSNFNLLMEADNIRGKYLKNVVELESLEKFSELTLNSIIPLKKLEDAFLQILGYTLLVEKSGHESSAFKEILHRYKIMEKIFVKLRKIRERQVKVIGLISKVKDFNKSLQGVVHKFYSWKLKHSLEDERSLILSLMSVCSKSKEEVKVIELILNSEESKRKMLLALKLGITFTPGGMLYLTLIDTIYKKVNRYTSNYRSLTAMVE